MGIKNENVLLFNTWIFFEWGGNSVVLKLNIKILGGLCYNFKCNWEYLCLEWKEWRKPDKETDKEK